MFVGFAEVAVVFVFSQSFGVRLCQLYTRPEEAVMRGECI